MATNPANRPAPLKAQFKSNVRRCAWAIPASLVITTGFCAYSYHHPAVRAWVRWEGVWRDVLIFVRLLQGAFIALKSYVQASRRGNQRFLVEKAEAEAAMAYLDSVASPDADKWRAVRG